jgi:hypothetical protein
VLESLIAKSKLCVAGAEYNLASGEVEFIDECSYSVLGERAGAMVAQRIRGLASTSISVVPSTGGWKYLERGAACCSDDACAVRRLSGVHRGVVAGGLGRCTGRAVVQATVRLGRIAVVALLQLIVHDPIAASRDQARTGASIRVYGVAVVARLHHSLHMTVAAHCELAQVRALVRVVGVAVITRLARVHGPIPARRRNRAVVQAAVRLGRIAVVALLQ